MRGPLRGFRVVEMAGIGPSRHAGMMLSDLGAEVVRIVRPGDREEDSGPPTHVLRGRRTVVADLKSSDDLAAVGQLIDVADVLVEGYRPGVMERLSLGPDECTSRNPGLVYGRMTGWGQTGPMAARAGHDINYISVTGALNAIGPHDHPVPPLNLIGDFGGGSMFLIAGVLAALLERTRSGRGQVVDAAMVDGVSSLLQPILRVRGAGGWKDERCSNLLDGAAPFYRAYRCQDGRFIAVGAIEPQFYALFVAGLGLSADELPAQNDAAEWPALSETFAAVVARHPRAHWEDVFDGTDACVTPVLAFDEVPAHPHIAARRSVVETEGATVAGAAPRFSRTDPEPVTGTPGREALTDVLSSWTTGRSA